MNKIKNIPLPLIILYGAIIIVGAIYGYRMFAVQAVMDDVKVPQLNAYLGNENGEKIIVEYGDYRCSFCRAIHPVLLELIERNPDVKLVMHHLPVFLKPSVTEAGVALAAGMQGHDKFVAAHNYLMERNNPITESEIDALVERLQLDRDKYYKDLKGPEIGMVLLNTLDVAELLNINATPTFIIGKEVYVPNDGMPTVETFEKKLAAVYGE